MPYHKGSPNGGISPKTTPSRFLRKHQIPYAPQHTNGFALSTTTGVPRPIRRPRKILYLAVIIFLLYWFGVRHGLGIERIPPPPLGYAVPAGRRGRRSSLSWGDLGMATVSPTPGIKAEHPIYELMERAEARWTHLLATQSTSLALAVAEYKRRYGISPPAGFEEWFAFCQAKGIRIVDDYDQLMKDLLPHHALEPEIFIARSQALEGGGFTYTLDVTRDSVEVTGERAPNARPKHLKNLIDGFRYDLPLGFQLKITGSDHDTGSTVLAKDQRLKAMQLVRAGECKLIGDLEMRELM